MAATHEVTNQPAPLTDIDLYGTDRPLRDALAFNAPGLDVHELERLGTALGSAEMQIHARLANVHLPQLSTHDRTGRRVDTVEFHPSYHALMALAVGAGLHGTPWASGTHAHVKRAAGFMLFTETEPSTLCPISMTYAVTPALQGNPALAAEWGPRLTSRAYDPRFVPAARKAGVTMGMGMTEKQGGSDVRANTTRAVHDGRDAWGERYRLTGHKWFMSAPMCDAFLVLAQTQAGLSCFFMPRFKPDGSINEIHFQRLKDKLGNRSNASSEVEFTGAYALPVGEPGRGVRTIIQMVQLTRQDCAIASAGLMRSGLAHALHHARHRSVFQKHLADHSLMQSVLADMALQVEASVALVMRLCRAFDKAPHDHLEAAYMRLMTPAVKYWICKSAPPFLYEAMECLGGNGYVEEGILARHYREAPVNAIWEGSGNVMCLDVLRAMSRESDAGTEVLQMLIQDTAGLTGGPAAASLVARAFLQADNERPARLAVETLAKLAAASALNEIHPPHAELFARTRLTPEPAMMYGAADLSAEQAHSLLTRALPEM